MSKGKKAKGIGLSGAMETFYMVVDMEKSDLFKSTLVQSICLELPYQYLGSARVFIAEHMQWEGMEKNNIRNRVATTKEDHHRRRHRRRCCCRHQFQSHYLTCFH